MNKTKIEWALNPDGTQGYTWNPITGCFNGCPYCYARKLADRRLKSRYLANHDTAPVICTDHKYRKWTELGHADYPFYPRFWASKMWLGELVGEKKKPKGVFVCDMSDLFGNGIPEDWTRRVLDVIRKHPRHRFYLLTKQPQNLIKWQFPDNCWVGVSIPNEFILARDNALSLLDDIDAKVKFISFEPLQSQILEPYLLNIGLEIAGINWVIIGQQTPVKQATMPKIEWIKEIVESCDKAGVAVFLKDNLTSVFVRTREQSENETFQETFKWALDKTGMNLRQDFPKV